MVDFLFIELYIMKMYNQKVENYFDIGKQSISGWRVTNIIPPRRLLEFYNREGSMDINILFNKIYNL